MATDDKTKMVLVVNNPTKPCGDAVIPPKGPPLHLARPDEAAEIESLNEAMKLSPGIHSLATKINRNFLLQRILKEAIAKTNARALDEAEDGEEDIK